ncbi:MAG: protein kinase [Pyrinomonadaceae bacterium]
MSDSQTPPFTSANADELPETEVDSPLPPLAYSQSAPENSSADSTLPLRPTDNTDPRPTHPHARNTDWLLGQTIAGRYVIEEKIGEGGFGAVYRARDRHNKMFARQMVIKFLKEKGLDNEWVLGKFRQEVEALARLDNHPGIVGLLDAGEFHNLPYIVLQYVNGTPLRKRIKPGGMELEEISEIVRQTASALAEAHSQEILHRDLKPENVMLRKLGSGETSVTVIDFGVAKVHNSCLSLSSETGSVTGTYPYMSPEQLRGQNKTMTPASEVYSLGVIAYEMLTGILPFNARDVDSLRQLQEEGMKVKPQDLRPDLPSFAQNVLLRALAFNPAERYQNIKTFGDELARTLRIPDRILIPSPPEKKNPALITMVLGLALIAVMGFVVWRLLSNNKLSIDSSANSPATAKNMAAPASAPQALAYSLTVQKVFDGRPMGAPEEYTGSELFGNGWKFKFNVTPTEDGYFYLLNAAPQPDGSTEWNVLFPTPKNNNGQAKIDGQQKRTFGWYVFDDKPGQERLWLIWSRQPIPDLETAVKAATQTALVIKEPQQIAAVTNFLKPWEKETPTVIADEQQKRTVIKSEQTTWAYLVKLRHDKY